MSTIINQTGYPIFRPNQVLTKDDLNETVSYLDGLNRLTRTHLIGMGIVCGLEVQTLGKKAGIWITPGCGITSEGFCIQYSPIPERNQAELKNTFTHYRDNVQLSKNLFIKSESPKENYLVRELITAEKAKTNPPDIQPLTALGESELYSQVLVVLYDWEDSPRQDYCQFNYDDRGQERNFRLRFLLLPSKDTRTSDNQVPLSAERLLRQGYQIDQLPEPWKGLDTEEIFELRNHFLQEFNRETRKFQDFAPQVQRFGCTPDGNSVDLTSINDYKTFREKYYQICENAITAIDKAFPKLFSLFSPFFTAFQPSSGDDFSQLKDKLENIFKGIRLENILDYIKVKKINQEIQTLKPEEVQSAYALQYFYDYLSLLVAAYYELAEAAFDLMDDCTPDTQRFPRFLMLGLVPSPGQATEVYVAPSAYRSHFTQPPIYNGNQLRIKQVRYLYQRLVKLCEKDSFYLLPFYSTPLKITPSKDKSTPLSEQAIPYYLNYPNLYQGWNYDAYRKGRSDRHPAYFYPKQNPEENFHEFKDWNYRLDSYNFYRIEGHIGKTKDDALKHIQNYKQQYNLAFDVITLKLDNQASLQDLNISGQFDDLESDFRRIKETFQKIWTKYATSTNNVLLNTLKRFFFERPGLTVMDSSQLSNFILERARKPEAYEFVRGNTDQEFNLYLRDKNNTRIARYVTQTLDSEGNSLSDFSNLTITFSEPDDNAIAKRKQTIIKDIINLLSLSQITYRLVIDLPNNPENYHLKLSTPDKPLSLPEYSLILLSETHFAVSLDRDNQFIINQSEFQDVETLYGLLRDVPTNFHTTNINRYQIGNPQIAEELNYFELMGLIQAYQRRLEQMMKLHLFDKFAQQNTGMEHLGGVPKGGTFVLVYVDGQDVDDLLVVDKDSAGYQEAIKRTENIQKAAFLPPSFLGELPEKDIISHWEKLILELQKRKDIVIADFCLPYRCGSNAPAVSYVVARSRPIILLEKTNLVFCEGDPQKYEFILEPEGGTVRGEGVVFEDSKQFFQPSSIDPASRDDLARGLEVAITFTYAVDDTYDTLTVTIYPLPRPNLSVSEGQNFCHNAAPVEIKLANGTPENLQLIQIKINDLETNILNPSQYAAGNTPETVTITAKIRNRQTQCENTLTRSVTINPLPEADLSVNDGQTFCNNANSLNITLANDTPKNIELIQVQIKGVETNTLNPSQYATEGEPETVMITAFIRNRQTQCENTLTRSVTINPLPQADLSVSDGQTFCNNAAPVEIILAEGNPENLQLIQVRINDIETNTLNPSEYATEGEPEIVTITALIRNQQTECENTLTRSVTIYPQPQADFQVEINTINTNGFSIRLFDIQPSGENSFTFNWEHDGISNPSNPGDNDFIISYDYDSNNWVADAVVSITLRVQTPPELGDCISEPVTKTIPIPIGGVREFQLLSIRGNEVVNTLTLRSDSTFNISDFNPNNEYAIAAVTTPPRLGSIVFNYTLPNGEAVVRIAANPPYCMANWQPTVGIHRITAQAAREINGDRPEGNVSTVTIRINDDNNSEPEPNPNQPRPRMLTLPNRLRILSQPSDENIAEFKTINYEEKKQGTREKRAGGTLSFSTLSSSYPLPPIKPSQLLILGITSLLLIVGWAYTVSRQTQNQPNLEPASNLRF